MPDRSTTDRSTPVAPLATPQPYYQDDFATIYNADCRDVLPLLSGIDMVLTSPPYNLRSEGHSGSGSEWADLARGYQSHDDDMPHPEYVAWQQHVLSLCWGTLSDTGAIFYNHKPLLSREPGRAIRMPFELVPEGMPLRQVVTWDRGSGMTRTHCHYVPRYEWILVLAREGFRLRTLDVDDLWRIPFETGSEHPAPFPLSLARRAIDSAAPSSVVDPFSGSGTTLRAAKDAGVKAVGIEISERYCEIAATRLAQEVLDFGGVA